MPIELVNIPAQTLTEDFSRGTLGELLTAANSIFDTTPLVDVGAPTPDYVPVFAPGYAGLGITVGDDEFGYAYLAVEPVAASCSVTFEAGWTWESFRGALVEWYEMFGLGGIITTEFIDAAMAAAPSVVDFVRANAIPFRGTAALTPEQLPNVGDPLVVDSLPVKAEKVTSLTYRYRVPPMEDYGSEFFLQSSWLEGSSEGSGGSLRACGAYLRRLGGSVVLEYNSHDSPSSQIVLGSVGALTGAWINVSVTLDQVAMVVHAVVDGHSFSYDFGDLGDYENKADFMRLTIFPIGTPLGKSAIDDIQVGFPAQVAQVYNGVNITYAGALPELDLRPKRFRQVFTKPRPRPI